MKDRLDEAVEDRELLEEIHELTNLMIAASGSPTPLSKAAIDDALELTP